MVSGLSGADLEVVPRLVEEVLNAEVENATILPLLVEEGTAREHHFNLLPVISTVVQVSRDFNDLRFVITSDIVDTRERNIFLINVRCPPPSLASFYHQLDYRRDEARAIDILCNGVSYETLEISNNLLLVDGQRTVLLKCVWTM